MMIRKMLKQDLPEVLINERASYDFPWSEGIFLGCLRKGYYPWVYEQEGIVGHAIMSIVCADAHILNVTVKPEYRNQKIGMNLMQFMLNHPLLNEVQDVFLEVRSSNDIAIRMYQTLCFNEVGVRKGYYRSHCGSEDAIVMAKSIVKDFN